MASIHKELTIDARSEDVWAAVRDVGAIHTRLAPGFVVDTRLEDGGARVVTFGNGSIVRELIVDLDDRNRRLCWAAVGAPFEHYNASMQIFREGEQRCRAVWIADLLPNELEKTVSSMIDQGLACIKQTLERGSVAESTATSPS
jgi:Polyketide cyclase / dehydrase and lipid transport